MTRKRMVAQLFFVMLKLSFLFLVGVSHASEDGAMLDYYGFNTPEKKEDLRFLMEASGVPVSELNILFDSERCTDEELLQRIIRFVNLSQSAFTGRTSNQERWEVAHRDWIVDPAKISKIRKALENLGLTKAVYPQSSAATYLAILGSTYHSMENRIAFAEKELREGRLKVERLILLTGERYAKLDSGEQSIDGSPQMLASIAKEKGKPVEKLTEADLFEHLIAHSPLSKKLPVTVIDVPRGKFRRATTETTVKALVEWLKGREGTITFISNQPYVDYQEAIIRAVFEQAGMLQNEQKHFFEVVGSGVNLNEENNQTVVLESLVAELGTTIYAKTPRVLKEMNLNIQDQSLKEKARSLFKAQEALLQQLESAL